MVEGVLETEEAAYSPSTQRAAISDGAVVQGAVSMAGVVVMVLRPVVETRMTKATVVKVTVII